MLVVEQLYISGSIFKRAGINNCFVTYFIFECFSAAIFRSIYSFFILCKFELQLQIYACLFIVQVKFT